MNELKKIILSGLFLAFSSVFVIFQIPTWVPFLTIEFSLVVLLIGRRFVGLNYSFVIATFYPWAAALTPWVSFDIIGIVSLITLGWISLIVDYFLSMDKNIKRDIFRSVLSVIIITILTTILSIILYTPWYYGFDAINEIANGNINEYIKITLYLYLPFNLLKQSIIFFLLLTYKKVIKKLV